MTVADASSASTLPGPADADWPSRYEMPIKPPTPEELPLPLADRDLRDTFDLPLMSARDAEQSGMATDSAIGDAAALLDDRGGPKRRVTAAEARGRARRCSQCGGLVPQGMSICVSCGMDQETGMRVGLADDLAPPPPPPPQGPPIHISLIGGLCGTCGLILLIVSIVRSVGNSADAWQKYGWLCLAMVSGFGIFAAVQFIRGRSAKLLMTALTLGVFIDLMTLIAMPMLQPAIHGVPVKEGVQSDDPDVLSTQIEQVEKQFDLQSIEVGIGLIMLYAVLSLYLMSPPVKKYIHPRAMDRTPW